MASVNESIQPYDPDDLMKAIQLTAMNVNGISEQMGLMLSKVNANTERITDLENRITAHEHTETINRAQCRRIRKSIANRVNYLLKIRFDGGKVADESIADEVRYRGPFISRCYTDAKNHSKMGESYTETLKTDFGEVMDYIESWTPEVDGSTDGYKRYLDIRREEKAKRSA